MAFDPIAFETALVHIERHLGYLRGNELAWEYLQQYPVDFEGQVPEDGEGVTLGPVYLEPGYTFPCPDGQYAVEPESPVLGWVPNGEGVSSADFVRQVQTNIDLAYSHGTAWASGIADYVRSVCDQFTQVDVAALSAEIRSFQERAVDPLEDDQANDDWAKLGEVYSSWDGQHKAAFVTFYTNYNDVEARWGRYLGAITTGAAMFTGLASATQQGAQKFLETLAKGLEEQLGSWVDHRGDPGSAASTPGWVANIPAALNLVLDLAGYVPPAAGAVKGVKTTMQVYAVLSKFGGDGDIPKLKEVPVKTADEICTQLTQTLSKDYLNAFKDGLEALDGGGSGAVDGDLEAQTYSASGLLTSMDEGDGVVPDAVGSGSLAGPGGHY